MYLRVVKVREITYCSAINETLHQLMERDERVILIGQGVTSPWYVGMTTVGLINRFGEGRVIDPPVSENCITGAAIGLALAGMRPICVFPRMDFMYYAMDQIANQIAKLRYMSGGKLKVPIVMRAPVGVTGRGAQHAQSLEPFFQCLPGIKIVVPSTAYDAKGLLKSAVRDENPVLMFEHKLLYGAKGARKETGSVDASSDIPDNEYLVPIGKAVVRREGTDVTIIATLLMVHRALEAAETLAAEGISAEVIDPRSLVPFDWELVKNSVAKTNKVVIVEESPKRGGIGSEIAATLAEEMIEYLTAPVKRVAAPNTPAPFAPPMEKFYVPGVSRIIEAVKEVVTYAG